jgi:hypothetical protein
MLPIDINGTRGRGKAEFVLRIGTNMVCSLNPQNGDPRAIVELPSEGLQVNTFSTEVPGQAVTGVLLLSPLRAVLF